MKIVGEAEHRQRLKVRRYFHRLLIRLLRFVHRVHFDQNEVNAEKYQYTDVEEEDHESIVLLTHKVKVVKMITLILAKSLNRTRKYMIKAEPTAR